MGRCPVSSLIYLVSCAAIACTTNEFTPPSSGGGGDTFEHHGSTAAGGGEASSDPSGTASAPATSGGGASATSVIATSGGVTATAASAAGSTTAFYQVDSKGGAIAATDTGASTGSVPTAPCLGGSNLFSSLLAKSSSEIETKLTTALNRFFGIGTGESATPVADTGYRVYYELPQDPNLAFIWAADSNDIRSEGMSYGMTIAVQSNLRTQFDRLWNFAKTYMQIQGSPDVWKYYFRWQGTVVTTNPANWTVTFKSTTGPAPDGDEYFAAALYMAHNRWGSAGSINYKQEADNITSAMLHNVTSGSQYPLIHTTQRMVVFYPSGGAYGYTDPSYHLPAFYELFAQRGPSVDVEQWKLIAATSRDYLVTSAHTTTGLHPDYASFTGVPVAGTSGGHDRFAYDAWRVVMNMAVDYAHAADFSISPSDAMKAQVEKYHAFFRQYLGNGNVTQCLFNVDGTNASGGGSTALTGTLAVGSLASTDVDRAKFVSNLWSVNQQNGKYRYYQECLHVMSLLHVAGRFQFCW